MPLVGRPKTPGYEKSDLVGAITKFINAVGIKGATEYGAYHSLRVSQAVRGHGILHLKPLVEALVAVSPHLMFTFSDLKYAYICAASQFGGLCPENRSPSSWASEHVERVQVLLNHVPQ